jgi:hypothetical protein
MGDGEQAEASGVGSEEQDKRCILVPSMGGILCDKKNSQRDKEYCSKLSSMPSKNPRVSFTPTYVGIRNIKKTATYRYFFSCRQQGLLLWMREKGTNIRYPARKAVSICASLGNPCILRICDEAD